MSSKVIVSLGGGCDAAIILERFGLRRTSLPFDWLWNLDTGLDAVQDMIATEFSSVTGEESCSRQSHYKWPGEKVVVFRAYPTIAHLHSNPLDKRSDWETFRNRAQKFTDLLQRSRDPIAFVYYRQHHEGPQATTDEVALERFETLVRESQAFVKYLRGRHAEREFTLLALFEVPDESSLREVLAPRLAALNTEERTQGLSFGYITERPEGPADDVRTWERAWMRVLLDHGVMSRADKALIWPRRRRDKLRKRLQKRLAKRRVAPESFDIPS